MVALIIGLVFIVFAVVSSWPDLWLNWFEHVMIFIKGGLPVLSMFIGLIAIFIGIADIKDRIETKKEEEEEKKQSSENSEK